MKYQMKKSGQRISAMRMSTGLTQKALAEKTGLSQGSISQIESGLKDIEIGKLFLLAEALGCSASYILYGEGSDPEPAVDQEAETFADEEKIFVETFLTYIKTLKQPKKLEKSERPAE